MNRYFIELSYNGTAYHGWQIQPNAKSVQEVIEQSLTLLLKEEIKTTGAGRTDTGVHALFYVAHFETLKEPALLKNIVYRLNGILPADIVIHRLYKVHSDMHARFSAVSRTYEYRVITKKDCFLNTTAYRVIPTPDFYKMNIAAHELLKYTDFTSFSKLRTDVVNNDCKVYFAKWEQDTYYPHLYIFTVTADRFLRNMVRAVVGTLLEVGQNKKTLQEFHGIIQSKNRAKAGKSVPGNALFLKKISYPDFEYQIVE